MSRHGYSDDCDNWSLICWRGQVASAIRGKRGQLFLRELVEALDALPQKRLIQGALRQADGEVCAMGAVGVKRGTPLEELDIYEHEEIATTFGIAHQLVQEIEYENDDGVWKESPEERWARIRKWAIDRIKGAP